MKYKKESVNPDKDSQSIQKKYSQDSNNKTESWGNFVLNNDSSMKFWTKKSVLKKCCILGVSTVQEL